MVAQIQTIRAPLVKNSDGDILVEGTRVTLDTVVAAHLEGDSPEEIVTQYPALRRADVYTAIGYYLEHQSEVEAYLKERREMSDQVRRENEARFPNEGVRERLRGRQND